MQACAMNIDMMRSSNLTSREGKHEAIHVVSLSGTWHNDLFPRVRENTLRDRQALSLTINRLSALSDERAKRGIGFARDQTQ